MLKTLQAICGPSSVTITGDEKQETITSITDSATMGDCTVEFQQQSEHTDIYLTSPNQTIKYIKARWDIRLPKTGRFLGDEYERGYGTMGFLPMRPNRIMPWYFICLDGEKTLAYGVRTRPNAICMWQVDPDGITLFMDVRNGGAGVRLGDRRLHVASIITAEYKDTDSFSATRDFCSEMATDPVFPKIPVYGSNNWYYAYGESSEEEILHDADYLAKIAEGATNRPFLVVDDCWQDHKLLGDYDGGPWAKGNDRFPNMTSLADKIKAKDLHTGIWIRPLLDDDRRIPDEWRSPFNHCLDPTHPDALQHIADDMTRLSQWGYELIKHDWSTFDLFGRWGFEMNPLITEEADWHFYNPSVTNAEVVQMLYKAIYDAAHANGSMILGCNTIGHLGTGYMEINRTGDDTSGKEWERTRQIGVNTLAFRLPQNGTFYATDADCVGIMGRIDWKYNRMWADAVAKSGTPLFVSAKAGVMQEQEDAELHEIMLVAAANQDHRRPADWEETDCPDTWTEGDHTSRYDWYEPDGVDFRTKPVRYISFLSSVDS